VLAFCWLAFPFTLYEDALGWNDSLVAAALVATLLVLGRPARRGALAAVAAWTKLAPLALVPLLATRRARSPLRDLGAFCGAFALVSALLFVPALAHGTLADFVSRSFGFQASRAPADSLWAVLADNYGANAAWLATASRVLHGLVAAIALATALLLPRARLRDDTAGVAAASAGVLLLAQLSLSYYSFSYILWFAPLALVALVIGRPAASAQSGPAGGARGAARPARDEFVGIAAGEIGAQRAGEARRLTRVAVPEQHRLAGADVDDLDMVDAIGRRQQRRRRAAAADEQPVGAPGPHRRASASSAPASSSVRSPTSTRSPTRTAGTSVTPSASAPALARSSSAAIARVCAARRIAAGWISHAAAAISTLSRSLSAWPPAKA
jgi:hypothetical protein